MKIARISCIWDLEIGLKIARSDVNYVGKWWIWVKVLNDFAFGRVLVSRQAGEKDVHDNPPLMKVMLSAKLSFNLHLWPL